MADRLRLLVAAPDRQLVDGDVDEVQVPAADGYMGVLPGHAPLLTALGSGVLSFRNERGYHYIAMEDGVMEVLPDRVRVLVGHANWANEVDVEHARVELQRATQVLEGTIENDIEHAQAAVARARAQLEAWDRAAKK
ncbi:MAG: ATP synthase F1 subunit epsilon [Acidobacteria bacterium]|nr:ATP synthase F1 subunit epsilon [Acidobacteriota bacterium]